MPDVGKETIFRGNLVKFVEAYQKRNKIQEGLTPKEIIKSISTDKLHEMVSNFLETDKIFKASSGGKRSRRSRRLRRRRKKKTRKNQRGGQFESFGDLGSVIVMVGAAIVGFVYLHDFVFFPRPVHDWAGTYRQTSLGN